MKRVLRVLELLVVGAALAVLASRGVYSDAYARYRAGGGRNGFVAWLSRKKFGKVPPWTEDFDETARKAAAAAREAKVREKAARAIARLEAAERELREKIARGEEASRQARQRAAAAAAHRASQKTARKGGHGGTVKTGGKSTFIPANGRTPYRVTGVRGIEFGSSENAPAANVKPVLSVTCDDDGNMNFKQLKWRENKALTESIYGFENAWLDHTFDTEQLSTVTLNKRFPFTDEGLDQAIAFYRQMSAEAASDLGFEVIDVDRTGNLTSSTICEFRNGDGDTSIRGGINAWSDKTLTVTLKISDNAYSSELRNQSDTAYTTGVADAVDARVEVWNKDYTDQKVRINEYLNN